MKHNLLGTVAIAALGAALAFAAPADAAPFGKGGGGGGGGGGRVSAAPMARSSGTVGMNTTRFNSSPQFTANNTARFNARPSNNFVANNSYARANTNWSGQNGNWSGRHHHHHRGGAFVAGVGLGLAYGGYGYCDPYDAYDCGYGYDYGPSYAYDEAYDTYAAAPEYAGGSVQYCMQRFRSYDLSTRTYLGTDGLRHSCP
jgi:BA14K-like protein